MSAQNNAVNIAAATAALNYQLVTIGMPETAGGTVIPPSGLNRFFDAISWRLDPGAGVTAGAIGFLELCLDNTLRKIARVTPIPFISATGPIDGVIAGPLGPVVMVVTTAVVGGPIAYAEMRGTWRNSTLY
jgi:hypothetical protein